MTCECWGCCDKSFEDFPEEIYVRLEWSNSIDLYTKMYRELKLVQQSTACACLKCYESITYRSELIFFDDGPPSDAHVCCAAVTLTGTCTTAGISGDCSWSVTFIEPAKATAPDPSLNVSATLDCLVEGVVLLYTPHHGNQCITAKLGLFYTLTFSESVPGGTEALPCDKHCCNPPPRTLYLTLASDCPQLNGRVVTLRRNGSDQMQFYNPPSPNIHGSHSISWGGKLKVCNCEHSMAFTVGSNTFTTIGAPANPQCRWSLSINNGACYEGTKSENDTEYCPPVTFDELPWGEAEEGDLTYCAECCLGDAVLLSAVLTE